MSSHWRSTNLGDREAYRGSRGFGGRDREPRNLGTIESGPNSQRRPSTFDSYEATAPSEDLLEMMYGAICRLEDTVTKVHHEIILVQRDVAVLQRDVAVIQKDICMSRNDMKEVSCNEAASGTTSPSLSPPAQRITGYLNDEQVEQIFRELFRSSCSVFGVGYVPLLCSSSQKNMDVLANLVQKARMRMSDNVPSLEDMGILLEDRRVLLLTFARSPTTLEHFVVEEAQRPGLPPSEIETQLLLNTEITNLKEFEHFVEVHMSKDSDVDYIRSFFSQEVRHLVHGRKRRMFVYEIFFSEDEFREALSLSNSSTDRFRYVQVWMIACFIFRVGIAHFSRQNFFGDRRVSTKLGLQQRQISRYFYAENSSCIYRSLYDSRSRCFLSHRKFPIRILFWSSVFSELSFQRLGIVEKESYSPKIDFVPSLDERGECRLVVEFMKFQERGGNARNSVLPSSTSVTQSTTSSSLHSPSTSSSSSLLPSVICTPSSLLWVNAGDSVSPSPTSVAQSTTSSPFHTPSTSSSSSLVPSVICTPPAFPGVEARDSVSSSPTSLAQSTTSSPFHTPSTSSSSSLVPSVIFAPPSFPGVNAGDSVSPSPTSVAQSTTSSPFHTPSTSSSSSLVPSVIFAPPAFPVPLSPEEEESARGTSLRNVSSASRKNPYHPPRKRR